MARRVRRGASEGWPVSYSLDELRRIRWVPGVTVFQAAVRTRGKTPGSAGSYSGSARAAMSPGLGPLAPDHPNEATVAWPHRDGRSLITAPPVQPPSCLVSLTAEWSLVSMLSQNSVLYWPDCVQQTTHLSGSQGPCEQGADVPKAGGLLTWLPPLGHLLLITRFWSDGGVHLSLGGLRDRRALGRAGTAPQRSPSARTLTRAPRSCGVGHLPCPFRSIAPGTLGGTG